MASILNAFRKKRPSHEPKSAEKAKKDDSSSSSSSEDEEQPEWKMYRDPSGRPYWHHLKSGHVTYGNSYAYPQQGYNPTLAQKGFLDSPPGSPRKGGAPAPSPAPAYTYATSPVPYAQSPVPYAPSPAPYAQSPAPYAQSPVPYAQSPVPYGLSPVPYGMSPVAVYPTAPWNVGVVPMSPVPREVPEYVKKQYAQEQKAKQRVEERRKKKEEEDEKLHKQEADGVWERFYDRDGVKYWKNTASGRTMDHDPYR